MVVKPIINDMEHPYRFNTYFHSKRKQATRANSRLTKDTVEISQEGMELYLKSKERLCNETK